MMQLYKFYLALIAVLISASCIQAGLGSWISSILPEPMRVSEKNRKHFDQARTIMGIKRPAIIRNAVLPEDVLGSTQNIGPFSIVLINEYKYPDQEKLINTIYHETGHVYHNHSAVYNGSLVTGKILFGMACCAFIKKAVVPTRLLSRASIAAFALHFMSQEHSIEALRMHEYEAQSHAIEAMAQAGHTDLLKNRLETLQTKIQEDDGDFRNRGQQYWTHDEEIAMIRAALNKKSL